MPHKLSPIFNISFIASLAIELPTIPQIVETTPSASQLVSKPGDWGIKHLKHGEFFLLKLKVNIWPLNLLTAPAINIFLFFLQKSLNKSLVLKLSDESNINL